MSKTKRAHLKALRLNSDNAVRRACQGLQSPEAVTMRPRIALRPVGAATPDVALFIDERPTQH